MAKQRKKKPHLYFGERHTRCGWCRAPIDSNNPLCVRCREAREKARGISGQQAEAKKKRELEHRLELRRIERELYGYED